MYRGYQINAEYAEAFEVVKAIDVYFSAGNHHGVGDEKTAD
jgi:hypothetical protein